MTAVSALFGADFSGEYLMTTIEDAGGKRDNYMKMSFEAGGGYLMMGMPMGNWKYDPQKQQVTITSPMFPEPDVSKVVSLDTKGLVLEHDGERSYYTKLDPRKIAKENPEAPVIGSWNAALNENASMTFTFSLPESFSCKVEDRRDNSTERVKGVWIYDPDNKTVIVAGFKNPLYGKSTIRAFDGNTIELENRGVTITAQKR